MESKQKYVFEMDALQISSKKKTASKGDDSWTN